ncbi:pyruvate kinase [Histomonas meleagridis]|uniref:pyruvate kinase n=1 Tax=Histomonas meleagridis TaxID=135588 RepID=UPI0035597912|nr:pyruvate kinase [Histomonas meleagridis]KAH0804154.1 pyruvate kinase [Histomonas meleagridis]
MRKTKIICTIGPACDSLETIKKLIQAGMNVARFNMSHGSHPEHAERIKIVRQAAEELHTPIGVLLDTKGPEVRVRTFENGQVEIKDKQIFTFTCNDVQGNDKIVSVSYGNLYNELHKGDIIMVNDGLLQFQVEEIKDKDIICTCLKGGVVSNRKGMNFPNINLKMPYVSEVDHDDIVFGIEQDVDFIAASFVSSPENIEQIRDILREHHVEKEIEIIAKIENRGGIDNIDAIYEHSNGIMVARGDMGVEIPFQQLPAIQKKLTRKGIKMGKRVIVATEMLESMIEHPRCTRAETSDVANAVYDGASAIMLSGETANGKYPILSVETMAKIALETEKQMDYYKQLNKGRTIANSTDAISHAACNAAHHLGAKLIFVFTKSGYSARKVSRFRPDVPIIAMVFNKKAYNKLSITWGIEPTMTKEMSSIDEIMQIVDDESKARGLKPGDKVIATCGWPLTERTNFMKIITLN